MKELELLALIGEARDKYVLEAAQTRDRKKSHLRLSRTALIAAIIAIALLLAGCVAVYLRLQDMKIGEETYTQKYDAYGHLIEPQEKVRDILSLAGWGGSPNYLAAKEWHDFRESYDPDEAIASGVVDRRGVPDLYWDTYGCQDAKMMDKVNEIAEKYGLKLLEGQVEVPVPQGPLALEALGIHSLFREGTVEKLKYESGGIGLPCNFNLYMQFTLPGEDWPYLVKAQMSYWRKDYFTLAPSIKLDVSEYQQWQYTTADGTKALLALGQRGDSYIFAEKAEAYLVISVDGPVYKYLNEDTQLPTKAVIEKIADSFDYSVTPKAVDGALLQWEIDKAQARLEEEREAASAARAYSEAQYATFRDWVLAHYENFDGSWYSDLYDYALYPQRNPDERYYTFYDVDGDGVEELLIGDGTGAYQTTLTMQGGEVMPYSSVTGEGIWLLQNGGIAYEERATSIDPKCGWRYYRPFAEGQAVQFQDDDGMNTKAGGFEKGIQYRDGQWNDVDPSAFPWRGTPITDEEAQAVIDAHPVLELSWYPITSYPADENGKTFGDVIREADVPSTEEERLALYREKAAEMQNRFTSFTLCALRDITGDGIEELLLSGNGTQIEAAFSVRYGHIKEVFIRSAYPCEGGVLEDIREYSNRMDDGRELHHIYYRMNSWYREQLDFVVENVAHGTFFRDMDGTPMEENEAREIMAKYPRVSIQWQKIGDFIEN